jgi:hypothetical protein
MAEYMKNSVTIMKSGFANTKPIVFQYGIIRLQGLKNLFEDMKKEFRIKYMLAYKVNQDALQNLLLCWWQVE